MRRKTVLLWIVTVVMFACTTQSNLTPQQKAEGSVKDYLNKNLNDPHSYESVQFGTLDSIKVDTAALHNLRIDESQVKDGLLASLYDPHEFDSLAKRVADSVHQLGQWQIEHSYRAKNGFGALMLTKDVFYLDSNLNVTKDVKTK